MNNLKDEFLLDPDIIFLNHGSFGATPRKVFEKYQYWQKRLEKQPVKFLGREASSLLEESRVELANYLGTQAKNLVYVTNTTVGINTIARSMKIGPEDIVIGTNHEYGAMERTWRFLSLQHGFTYLPLQINPPVKDIDSIINIFSNSFTENTKILFISHIASSTSLIFPIREICSLAHQRGIITIIDGAHAPGQIHLDLNSLGADFYVGNLHKWLCAPKGSAFIFARPELQHLIEPLVVSWGWQSDNPGDSQFIDYLEWTGTRDLSAYLTVPEAIRFQREHHWDQIRNHCHQLASSAHNQIGALTHQASIYPDDPRWYMQMGSSILPLNIDSAALKKELYDRYRIEIPIISWNNQNLIRFSFQAYNDESDVVTLIMALKELLY